MIALDLGVLGPQGDVGQLLGAVGGVGVDLGVDLDQAAVLEPLEAGPHGVLGDLQDAPDLAQRLAGVLDEAAEQPDVDGVEVGRGARGTSAAHR